MGRKPGRGIGRGRGKGVIKGTIGKGNSLTNPIVDSSINSEVFVDVPEQSDKVDSEPFCDSVLPESVAGSNVGVNEPSDDAVVEDDVSMDSHHAVDFE